MRAEIKKYRCTTVVVDGIRSGCCFLCRYPPFDSQLTVNTSRQIFSLLLFGLGLASIQANSEWRPNGGKHGLEPGRRKLEAG